MEAPDSRVCLYGRVAMRYDVITVDIDKPYKVVKKEMPRIVELAERLLGMQTAHWTCRPSPNDNTHCWFILYYEVRDCHKRYHLARLLGDDIMRSLLNLERCLDGDAREILFSEKKRLVAVSFPGDWFFTT